MSRPQPPHRTPPSQRPTLDRLLHRAIAPVDLASVAAFRVLFGLLMSFGAARFLLYGWVDRFFGKPSYYFTYWGFEWVRPLGAEATWWMFAALVVLGLMIASGFLYRVALPVALVLFTYVELIDVTNYLNHYYLVSLLGLLLCAVPAHGLWSADARLRPSVRRETLPAFLLWLLRAQVVCVYFNAGLAKAGADWLLHAQPLNIWLSSRVDTPVIGPLLGHWHTALAMGWAGFLFDTTIAGFLLWRRTRPWAFVVVVIFHTLTNVFFNIGLFPLIMISAATLLLDASWPRALARRLRLSPSSRAADVGADAASAAAPVASHDASHDPSHRALSAAPTTGQRVAIAAAALWCVVQFAMPLRGHLYGGDLLWHEQGMRWSWRVMVREKNGSITYRVRLEPGARAFYVPPSRYLTDHQEREMSGQPDMIVQLGQHIGREYRGKGFAQAQVYVDALVSLNGRPMQRLIDPEVDLMTLQPGLTPARWILPAPTTPTPRLGPRLLR